MQVSLYASISLLVSGPFLIFRSCVRSLIFFRCISIFLNSIYGHIEIALLISGMCRIILSFNSNLGDVGALFYTWKNMNRSAFTRMMKKFYLFLNDEYSREDKTLSRPWKSRKEVMKSAKKS